MGGPGDGKDKGHNQRHRFYDIDYHLERIRRLQPKPLTGGQLVARKLRNTLGSAVKMLDAMVWLSIWAALPALVVTRYYFGPIGVFVAIGATLTGLYFYVDRKVGRSIQFADYHFWRKVFATVIAFLALAGVFYALFFLI